MPFSLLYRIFRIQWLLRYCTGVLLLFVCPAIIQAQFNTNRVPGAPVTLDNAPQLDSTSRTNTSDWQEEKANIYFKKHNSLKKFYPDTSIHTFHRRAFGQQWTVHTGNAGSPVQHLLFTPGYRTGPVSGYRLFDAYRFHPDSLDYYHTTRPYSVVSYHLGSKAEQMAAFLHTQNINPGWNIAVQYRKITAPGYYKVQRTNHDIAALTSNYTSKNLHYQLYGGITYSKFQHDENGGILADSLLTDGNFSDRKTIPTLFQDDAYSIRRSAVTNMQRNFSVSLWHHYTIGKKDTLYNEDSTRYHYTLIPRFRVTHHLRISSEKYQYKDLRPDSLRYTGFFEQQFTPGDSVFTEQKWFSTDNSFSLNGFIGRQEQQLAFSAGIGIRTDKFTTGYAIGETSISSLSNYLIGNIRKEAMQEKQWDYDADALFFFTGPAAGNFKLQVQIGKDINKTLGSLSIGLQQELNNAPYNHSTYANRYLQWSRSFSKESITRIYGTVRNKQYGLEATAGNYIISNYFFLNGPYLPDQFSGAFSITQVSLRKIFRFGKWVADNEFAWQQQTGDAPVNIPAIMGRHQLSIETHIFRQKLKIATGIDIRYHSAYHSAGYSPILHRYFYQRNYEAANIPEAGVFFNFMVKRMRVYVMGDQLQQFFTRNIIHAPGYPYQNAMLRFGFSWIMIN